MPTILLADDNPDWPKTYERDIRFRFSGWKFLVAHNVESALSLIRLEEQIIDAAILDKNLKQIKLGETLNISGHHNGFEVAAALKEINQNAYVILMTGEGFNGFFLQGLIDGRFPVNAFGDKGDYSKGEDRLMTCIGMINNGLALPKFVFLTDFEEQKWGKHFPRAREFWESNKPSGKERL
jgi:hypothetical protein